MIRPAKLWMWLVVGLVAVSAVAQTAQREEGQPVNLSLGFSARWTDNRDSAAMNEEENIDLYVRPRLDAYLDWERTILNLYYSPAFRYRNDPSLDQNDTELQHALGANLDHDLTPQLKLVLKEKFDLTDDPSVEAGGSTIQYDQSYIMNQAEGKVRFQLNRWTSLDVYGRNMLKRYDKQYVADESDEDRNDVGLLLWRQVSPTVAMKGGAEYGSYAFDSLRKIDRDFDLLTAVVGVEKVFNPQLRGGVKAGWQEADPSDAGLDSNSDFYGELALRGSSGAAKALEAVLSHGIRDSDVYPFSSQVYTELRGKIDIETSPNMTINLGGTYRLSEYDQGSLPASAVGEAAPLARSGDETTIVGKAGVTCQVADNSKIKLEYIMEDIDSDVDVSFTRNVAVASLLFDL